MKTKTSESDLECDICNGKFSIAASGQYEIQRHINAPKHKQALDAISKSRSVTQFFPSSTDYNVSACEGVWAYHVIKENQSFRSSDCASKVFRKCFDASKFHCARTKCEAIATNVFAPFSTNEIKSDLENSHYVCLAVDASNHGSVKMMPVVVRFFKPLVGVKVKLLEMSSEKGETSEIIANLIKATAEEYKVIDKMVAFCGDNCPTNFGSRERGGERNVYFRLKQWMPKLIGVGCAAHIVHNALKSACDGMPFDVECLVVKIYSHFYLYTVRVEALKTLCDAVEGIENTKLLGYSKTRFLALGPAIESILKVYDALKVYFLNLRQCPNIIKQFFEDPTSKLWLLFIKSQVSQLFAQVFTIRQIFNYLF